MRTQRGYFIFVRYVKDKDHPGDAYGVTPDGKVVKIVETEVPTASVPEGIMEQLLKQWWGVDPQ